MALRVAQFNILGRKMAGTMWFHYARDFLPKYFANSCPDWYRQAGFPRCLLWNSNDGPGRFYRLPVLLAEIRALEADILCLVELDCFEEFRDALAEDGYDSVFRPRPGKADGCGIFWRREVLAAREPCRPLTYSIPANDRIALAQPLEHLATGRRVLAVSTHLYWDQQSGHQAAEAEELLALIQGGGGAAVVCADLNAIPGAAAYKAMRRHLRDAALQEDSQGYPDGAFTSCKPDVYYYAKPRGQQYDSSAQEEWHLQAGRREVIDYIFYDPAAFQLQSAVSTPRMAAGPGRADGEPRAKNPRVAAKPPYGFWAGGWAFASSPAPGWQAGLRDPDWWPERRHGELQLGIPNRLHGSDHLPIVCTLKLQGESSKVDSVVIDADSEPDDQR